MCLDPVLRPAVLTSSSPQRLADLFRELAFLSGATEYEVFLLRDTDISELTPRLQLPADHTQGATRLSAILKSRSNADTIVSEMKVLGGKNGPDYRTLAGKSKIHYRAIATYLPDITSLDKDRFEDAVLALINAGYIASHLEIPVVEMVAGTILDACKCSNCLEKDAGRGLVLETQLDAKINLLIEGMKRVLGDRETGNTLYAIEMEPGPVYVVNGIDAMKKLAGRIVDPRNLTNGRLGFNVDIGHMLIKGISADDLRTLGCSLTASEAWKRLLFHAHISDAPQTHTCDQAIGRWTAVASCNPSPYDEYIRLLKKELSTSATFSKTISIELEGCDHIGRIQESLTQLRYLIERCG